MNGRKSKAIRRAISANGLDPRDAQVTPAIGAHMVWSTGIPGIGKSVMFLGQRTLARNSGRGAYRALKAAVRRGEVRA